MPTAIDVPGTFYLALRCFHAYTQATSMARKRRRMVSETPDTSSHAPKPISETKKWLAGIAAAVIVGLIL
jgi:hypothetical protein